MYDGTSTTYILLHLGSSNVRVGKAGPKDLWKVEPPGGCLDGWGSLKSYCVFWDLCCHRPKAMGPANQRLMSNKPPNHMAETQYCSLALAVFLSICKTHRELIGAILSRVILKG